MAQATKLRLCLNRVLPWNFPSATREIHTLSSPPWLLLRRIQSIFPQQPPEFRGVTYFQLPAFRSFRSASTDNKVQETKKNINTKVNFSLSDSESDSEDNEKNNRIDNKVIDKSNLPPPYDPFSNKPAIEEPEDPKDLQLIFHKMRSEGLINNAVKMFDALSQDGLTHEALELFSQIKDKGHMPDVVGHTAVIEAYANSGGRSKEAVKVFLRMLSSGVKPNAYTYSVLIKGLAADGKLGDSKKYVLEMMSKGMNPNAATYIAVFEAYARQEKAEEARELLLQMKEKGFSPDEKSVCEILRSKRGQVFTTVFDILFNK
ncbi:pentatricopeptide repeat-containing protein At4g38150-like [Euphorbia lathyris]|uniref:pentatricopeptide repeat-containing protein At4g38150-like n=1 Tax=Euphorbia lathyris TaxID=212925 RepID=UPI003313255F